MRHRVAALSTRLKKAVSSIGAGHHLAQSQVWQQSTRSVVEAKKQEIRLRDQETWSGRASHAHQQDMNVIRRPWREACQRDQAKKETSHHARVVAKVWCASIYATYC